MGQVKLVNSDVKESLVEKFKEFFTIDFSDTAEIRSKIYNVRYRVYCEEFKYEDASSCPNEQEIDSFDDKSLHCLITHKRSQIPAACVRLVPTDGKGDVLPFESYCAKSMDKEFIKSLNVERETICEVSRLAVDRTFRRRKGEKLTRFGDVAIDFSDQEQRTFLLIAVAAFIAATALTKMTGRTNVFAMMEPFLPRMLKRAGIIFQQAGTKIDYHGIRALYYTDTHAAPAFFSTDLQDLYHWIYSQIENKYPGMI